MFAISWQMIVQGTCPLLLLARRGLARQGAGGVQLRQVDTDVLYQWRTPAADTRTPAYPIEGLHVSDITMQKTGHVCRILAKAEQPVRDVRPTRVQVAQVSGEPDVLPDVDGYAAGT